MSGPDITSSLFLPLPDGLMIDSVRLSDTGLVVQVTCVLPQASCPLCQSPSERIHSSYGRTVADVPCGGRHVRLALTVRKFVCGQVGCPRQIFTERLPDLVQPYARMTNRLREALQALGFATCAEAGVRLAQLLGMSITATTLLRRMRDCSCSPPASVRVLGIDDWAWKRGQTYGTLLVDLERRCPIEILPDRKTETVEAWLRSHPEIEVISRDRGGEYAAAARRGAPQAQQVADKFHLLLNLREKLKDLMARHQNQLPEVEAETSDAIPLKALGKHAGRSLCPKQEAAAEQSEQARPFRKMSPLPRTTSSGPSTSPPEETPSQISRSNRAWRYEAVHMLHQQAISERGIARRLRMSRNTVHRFLKAERLPERSRTPYRGSILDPYKPYLLERWKSGCWNGVQLYSEIKQLGYTGSEVLCRFFITSLRKEHQRVGASTALALDASGAHVRVPADCPSKPSPKRRMSPSRASWLSICQPDKLDEQQRKLVEQLLMAHPDLKTPYQLSQAFVSMPSRAPCPGPG